MYSRNVDPDKYVEDVLFPYKIVTFKIEEDWETYVMIAEYPHGEDTGNWYLSAEFDPVVSDTHLKAKYAHAVCFEQLSKYVKRDFGKYNTKKRF